MKINLAVLVLAAVVVSLTAIPPARAAEEDGVALAIVYDTSGSMREEVRDRSGRQSPKYVIANRALVSIVRQIQSFATNTAPAAPCRINAALFTFRDQKAHEAVAFGPFDAAALENWAGRFNNPDGGTPLGNTVKAAAERVLDSPLARKHILVLTDGMNTQGPDPAAVLPALFKQAEKKPAGLSVHFVAFDVDAKVFASVKKLGATVVGAADESQLNAQLDFILKNEILLEKAEPAKKN